MLETHGGARGSDLARVRVPSRHAAAARPGYEGAVRDIQTRYMVLGGPVPEALQRALAGVVELVGENEVPDTEVDGVLIHARPESRAIFQHFRSQGGSLPIFALAENHVGVAERLQWIRAGADDLLDLASAAETLRRKLRAPPSPDAVREDAERGMFLDRYLRCMHRYVAARQAMLHKLGEQALSRYLDCVFLRDQALKAAEDAPADAFGQRRGGQREPLKWPMRVTEPFKSTGALLNVGADGCAISLPVQPTERLRLAVDTGAMSALVDVEVRWQRRAARDRWELGGLITGVHLVESRTEGGSDGA